MKHNYVGVIVGGSIALVVGIAAWGGAGYVALNRQHVVDQLRAASYKPTAAVTEQIHRTDMSSTGRFLYLASEPTVEDKATFNNTCGTVTGDSSVLGCYVEKQKRIYVYHETDSRLDGTEEVWAAHEMLRAAWDRMTPAQHGALLGSLNDALAAPDPTDVELSARIADVAKHDPGDRDGELYATVGSEVPTVEKKLEKSYDAYFVDRRVVTKLATHSHSYERALAKKVFTLTTAMDHLETTLDRESKSFNSAVKKLISDIKAFNSRAETPGGFPTEAQFDVARAALISRQHSLEKKQKTIKSQYSDFKADLKKLDGLSSKAASLYDSLNLDLAPLPGINA